jgi:uncharacterized protein YjiS (DUF1127 family)
MFMKRNRKTRLDLKELSHLDARLLRDIGLEPADVYDALNGRRLTVWLNPMRRISDHE